ncbi:hypothetical protein JXI42_00245 [bacterium]|nr:hypothetical protein [bacterium]
MKNTTEIPIPHTPKEYWDDSRWANENIAEISKKYPNLWVAIVNRQVVASGKLISEVRKIAEKRTKKKHFPVIFTEKGINVY